MISELNILNADLTIEMKRISKLMNDVNNMKNLVIIYEEQYKTSYSRGDDIAYKISKLNLLKKSRNEKLLC